MAEKNEVLTCLSLTLIVIPFMMGQLCRTHASDHLRCAQVHLLLQHADRPGFVDEVVRVNRIRAPNSPQKEEYAKGGVTESKVIPLMRSVGSRGESRATAAISTMTPYLCAFFSAQKVTSVGRSQWLRRRDGGIGEKRWAGRENIQKQIR